MAEEQKLGAPFKANDEKKVGFTVICKVKNVAAIKPLVKEYVKDLDKKDWEAEKECEKPCGSNYCDEMGCMNRKRNYTEPSEKPSFPPDRITKGMDSV